ncbi:MAG: arsenic resistance N-acetyltransferase ArsN2 [Opitutales bacterium]
MLDNIDAVTIESAAPADEPAIGALLQAARLPSGDFAPHLGHFLVARQEGTLVGAVGAEVCGEDALLRSLVVTPAGRGNGLGQRLLGAMDRAAPAWGVKRWWLLTTTAEVFFSARGFQPAGRDSAPPGIRATGQFTGGCCASAACLTRGVRTP